MGFLLWCDSLIARCKTMMTQDRLGARKRRIQFVAGGLVPPTNEKSRATPPGFSQICD